MPEPAPEAKAREQIDVLLTGAGWALQDYTRFDATASRFIALREIPVTHGRCDYLLLIDRNPLGVIEAKKAGTRLSMVAEQSAFYGANLPDFLQRPIAGARRVLFLVDRSNLGRQATAEFQQFVTPDLKGMPIPIAPTTEQMRIVAEVERRLSVIDELETVVTANLQRATRLRQSILERAFSGRLVPTVSS